MNKYLLIVVCLLFIGAGIGFLLSERSTFVGVYGIFFGLAMLFGEFYLRPLAEKRKTENQRKPRFNIKIFEAVFLVIFGLVILFIGLGLLYYMAFYWKDVKRWETPTIITGFLFSSVAIYGGIGAIKMGLETK